ncbi:hypothetical protein HDU76_007943, partial [Blyttiomyces sp. JEL0837]
NIRGMMDRGDNLESLNNRTEQLQSSSAQFQSQSKAVRRKMFWKDTKTRIIIAVAAGVLLALIIGLSIWSVNGTKARDNGTPGTVPLKEGGKTPNS